MTTTSDALKRLAEELEQALKAEVWDEGYAAGHADGRADHKDADCVKNPYREAS